MISWLLDSVTHDLVFEFGDLALTDNPLTELRQSIKILLLAHQGEWFLDTEFGIPYRELIVIKNPDLDTIKATLANKIMQKEGVTGIRNIEASIVESTRSLTLSVNVDTIYGPTGDIVV